MSKKLIHLTSLFAAGAVLVGAAPTLGAHPVTTTTTSVDAQEKSGSCGSKDMKDAKKDEGKKDDTKKGDAKKDGKGKKGGKEGSCGSGSCGGKDMKDKKEKKGEKKDGSCGSKGMKDEKKN